MVQHHAEFPHSFYYPDNEAITLSDIAATLVAHEKLVAVIPDILEDLLPGLGVEKVQIRLTEAKIGSLSEAFFVALFVTYQKQLDEELPALVEALTGLKIPDGYDTLVTVIFLIIIYSAFKKIFERSGAKGLPPSMQGDHNTYINVAGDLIGMAPEQIEEAVERSFTKKRKVGLQKAALDVWRPAKRGGSGRIQPRGLPEIPRQSVVEVPDDIALADAEPSPDFEPYDNVLVTIRATDRDKATQGWWGRAVIERKETRRLPLTISPAIDLNAIAAADAIRADIILESSEGADGEHRPKRIHIMRAQVV